MGSRTVSIRLSFAEFSALAAVANERGMRPSELVRACIRLALFEKGVAQPSAEMSTAESAIDALRGDIAVSMEAILVLSKMCKPEEARAWVRKYLCGGGE